MNRKVRVSIIGIVAVMAISLFALKYVDQQLNVLIPEDHSANKRLDNHLDAVILPYWVYKQLDSCQSPPTTCPNENGDWDCNETDNPVNAVYFVNFVYSSSDEGTCEPCVE